jgi:putative transposase
MRRGIQAALGAPNTSGYSNRLAAVQDTSISGIRVVRELAGVIARRGRPEMIVSDNGTERTSNTVLKWA